MPKSLKGYSRNIAAAGVFDVVREALTLLGAGRGLKKRTNFHSCGGTDRESFRKATVPAVARGEKSQKDEGIASFTGREGEP